MILCRVGLPMDCVLCRVSLALEPGTRTRQRSAMLRGTATQKHPATTNTDIKYHVFVATLCNPRSAVARRCSQPSPTTFTPSVCQAGLSAALQEWSLEIQVMFPVKNDYKLADLSESAAEGIFHRSQPCHHSANMCTRRCRRAAFVKSRT
jgi:hypothetical protein